jgi:amidase
VTDPADLSAVEARRLIGARELSPVELAEACIARIERLDGTLNAVVARDFERARAAARLAEGVAPADMGPLHGLPFGVKDLTETAGLRTTWGSRLFADHVPAKDDPLVARLRAAGGIVLGKTNTPEFGAGAVTTNPVYGMTGNPFDPEKTSSGSSGGSASALAAGMMTLATGSDFGGSLRTPAAYCGVCGFRPTPGAIPDTKKLRAWSPLSVEGPMARTAADLRLMFAAMVGRDPLDPLSGRIDAEAVRAHPPVDPGALRVGFSADLGFFPVDPAVRAAFEARVAALRPVFRSLDAVTPPLGADPHRVFEALRGASFIGAHLDKVERTPDLVGPRIHENVALGRSLSLADVVEAEKAQTRLHRAFQAMFRDIDLLVCPTVAVPPFDKRTAYVEEVAGVRMRTYIEWVGLTWGITLTASPALSLPTGLDATGMPFGLQLVGPAGSDARLLAIAEAVEAALARDPATARPVPDLGRIG